MRSLTVVALPRRAFLQRAGLGALGLAIGCAPEKSSVGDSAEALAEGGGGVGDDPTPGDTGSDVGEIDEVAIDPWGPAPEDCAEATEELGTGPFYRPGAPERNLLNIFDEEGTPLRVYFRVLDATCAPIVGAFIEIWHCAPEAAYDMSSDDMRFYGVQYTDAEGKGWIQSIKPPPYIDDAGHHSPHIHFQITATGFDKLAMQFVFLEDDPGEIDKIPAVSLEEDDEGYQVALFEFVLVETAVG